jgi:hypothetical protein
MRNHVLRNQADRISRLIVQPEAEFVHAGRKASSSGMRLSSSSGVP